VESGETEGIGASAYGIRVIDGAQVTILNSTIIASDGTAGTDGTNGTVGLNGTNGANGAIGDETGGGAVNIASPAVRTGGTGGDGISCVWLLIFCASSIPGLSGGKGGANDPRGGNGGSGGADSAGGGGGGFGGVVAPAAAPGAGGAPIPGDTFNPGAGGTGGLALAGAGGGGGGGGGSGSNRSSGGGGAGGSGGTTGTGGTGGGGGGGSFAVYTYNSSVTISGTDLITGSGGAGGMGGNGGNGGVGGNGGNGASTSGPGAGGGGAGGGGGNGGGGGAGGRGGPSVGAYHAGTGTQIVEAADEASLALIGAGGVGGQGGQGGIGGAGGAGGAGGGNGTVSRRGEPGQNGPNGAQGSTGNAGATGLRRVAYSNGVANNVPPVAFASASPTSGIAPEAVTFSSAGSYDADGVLTYLWDFGDGNTSTEANPVHTYTVDGTFLPVLTVTDDDGATATASTQPITIAANQLPVAVANGTPDKANNKAPLVVDFSSAGSADGDGTIVAYDWDFGDGATSTEANPTHTYTAEGLYEVTLTVTDDKGGTGTATVMVDVNPDNVAPEVSITATPTFGKAPVTVQFSSTVSDSDGTITDIVWDFGDGSPTSNDPNPTHTYSAGVWTATFTATDDDGATTTRSVEVRSLPNLPPTAVASATPTTGRAPLTVQFSSSGSIDFDGTIASYSWNFGDGSPTSSAPNPTHTYGQGTWTATLTVTDNEGAVGTASVAIVVTVNQAPTAVANATFDGTKAPLTVEFSSAGSVDNDGVIVSYEWDFGDGSAVSNDPNPTHTYLVGGTYAATLTVTDNEGGTDVKSVTINVAAENVAPTVIVSADPTDGRAPLTVEFSSAGSFDEDGTIVSYVWDFGDGSPVDNSPDTSHTYAPGTWTATLTATDDDGASTTVPVTIFSTVNQAPTAVATGTPLSGLAPLEVEFDSSGSSDSDGEIVAWAWNFGDGNTSTDPNPTHLYAVPGSYIATLTITDNEGATANAIVPIVANIAPVAVASADVTFGDAPLTVNFTGSDSSDPDGTIVSYQWDFGDGATSTLADPEHVYSAGIYTATLTVVDDQGATATATIEIDVNDPPTASVTSNVTTGAAPLTVDFTGTAADSDGTFTISWDFGDGSPPDTSTLTPTHTFDDPGTYEVTLTVTDDRGAVTVSAPRIITAT
jgi:PKD repeat protein